MNGFEQYVCDVESLVLATVSGARFMHDENSVLVEKVLNGQPSHELRKNYDIQLLRDTGTFFTGRDLAQELIVEERESIIAASKILDPACGAGDLLLACLKYMPLSKDKLLVSTLNEWGEKLAGFDLNPLFIRLAKARLVLAAIKKGAIKSPGISINLSAIFPDIRQGNGLDEKSLSRDASLIVMNPPYSYIDTPPECDEWTSGKVSLAAVFMAKYCSFAKPNTRIAAILPEVLRTGRRYAKWRREIERLSVIRDIFSVGIFDKLVDIDVFVLRATISRVRNEQFTAWWDEESFGTSTSYLGELFKVHVGPVVPHRHPLEGDEYPYIHARSVPPWEIIDRIEETRRFSGTVFQPPFVVIRITSRPGGGERAVGAIINVNSAVAVENHLIVLQPKDGSVKTCEKIMAYFRSDSANNWLNERIRCRHLTVSSVLEMPLSSTDFNVSSP